MHFPRSSGVLLHITSLPGGVGIGDMGPQAIRFVDFLRDSGQKVWQVLPLGPPARGNSPYSCYSAFAGNPLMISLEQMVADGWLRETDLPSAQSTSAQSTSDEEFLQSDARVNFDVATQTKRVCLRAAFDRCSSKLADNPDYKRFIDANKFWLPEFARFESLMRYFDCADWTQWPTELVRRESDALQSWDKKLAGEISFSKFVQFLFDRQWNRIKTYANDFGIQIFGDMPIFVAFESADVWSNQSLYELEPSGHRRLVAGVPPDYFSVTGQLWGNPLYRWPAHEANGYRWWIERFRFAFEQFDWLRVDHFRGFEAYWEIPASAATAMEGQWRTGPGSKPFDAARDELGPLPIIAEDLGMITDAVHQLREKLGYPAMRVLQFGFDDPDDVFHHPHHYPRDSVAYTGTHDNDTLMGWHSQRPTDPDSDRLLRELLDSDDPVHWQLIAAVLNSGSDIAIVPMQDLLALGNGSRMNLPGQADGNWGWRMKSTDITGDLAETLRQATLAAKR